MNINLLDPDIREKLFIYLENKYTKLRFMDEVNIGHSRADVLAITDGIITGFEIKSDADSYARLKRQILDYNKYCDYCYIVIGKKHELTIENHVPVFWGILVINNDNLEIIRDAALNPNVTIKYKLNLLWKKELIDVLSFHKLSKFSKRKKNEIIDILIKLVKTETLLVDITNELFERDYTI